MNRTKPVIVMVEDEADYTTLLRAWLEDVGEFYAFKSGEEFLAALPALVPDVVILDLFLQGVDGVELCRRMREIPTFKSVPVLFLTGSNRAEDFRRGLRAGGNAFLTKPVSRARLLAEITDLLAKPVLHREGGG